MEQNDKQQKERIYLLTQKKVWNGIDYIIVIVKWQ